VFRVDMIHRNFKHIVAADADAMDFRRGLLTQPFRARVIRVAGLLLFAHGRILSHSFERRKLSSRSALKQLADTTDNLSDAHRAVVDRGEPWAIRNDPGGCRRKREIFGTRSNENRRRALDEFLNCGVPGNLSGAFQDDDCWDLPRSNRAPDVFSRLHPQRIDAQFAELSADGRAQFPIPRDHKNYRHLGARV
jgi:hypothetical protein